MVESVGARVVIGGVIEALPRGLALRARSKLLGSGCRFPRFSGDDMVTEECQCGETVVSDDSPRIVRRDSLMKYVLMFTSRPDLQESIDPERAQEVYGKVYKWFEEHGAAGRIVDGGAELHPVETATTVRAGSDGAPVVVDGPFSEAKEVVGGFTIIDVPDLDAAIAMTKSWPSLAFPGVAVEIRPMVVDYSQFD
jgi:hypothetical protein